MMYAETLKQIKGTHRRFDFISALAKKKLGEVDALLIIRQKIKATLSAASMLHNKLRVVAQTTYIY